MTLILGLIWLFIKIQTFNFHKNAIQMLFFECSFRESSILDMSQDNNPGIRMLNHGLDGYFALLGCVSNHGRIIATNSRILAATYPRQTMTRFDFDTSRIYLRCIRHIRKQIRDKVQFKISYQFIL